MKAVAYLRVSTREQGQSGLGVEAQQAEIVRFCEINEIELVDSVVEIASAKGYYKKRPVLNSALERCKKEKCALIVSKLDRLSRDVESIANLTNDKAIRFVVANLGLKADNMTIGIHAVVAQQERDLIGKRTSDALQAKKARGESLGGNSNLKDAQNKGMKQAKTDANNFAETMRIAITGGRLQGLSWGQIAKDFTGTRKTARGGDNWTAQQVINIAERLGIG
jgi:DNA invertase Pin-like site-specific DNA recombinase